MTTYVETDDFGVQVLLNFRSGQERFRTLSLNDIKTENFNPSWIRDRIRLTGVSQECDQLRWCRRQSLNSAQSDRHWEALR